MVERNKQKREEKKRKQTKKKKNNNKKKKKKEEKMGKKGSMGGRVRKEKGTEGVWTYLSYFR